MLDNSLIISYPPQKGIPSFQVGTFLSGTQKMRALVPVHKGLVFYGDEKNKNIIYSQIQYTLLIVLQTIPIDSLKITILDINIDNTFRDLLMLADCIKIAKLTDVKSFETFMETLRQHAIHINHELLSHQSFESLAAYNQSVEFPEPYHIVVLTDSWRQTEYFKGDTLRELIEKGSKAGIYFICVLDGAAIEAEKKALKKEYKDVEHYKKEVWQTCDCIAQQLIGITPTPNGKAVFSNIQIPAFQRLTQAFFFKYSNYPSSEVQQVFNTLRKNIEKRDVATHNFLEVPIGRVGNRPVLWAFGDKSGSYNAFIAGAVGSGKTSFLQNLILTIAEKHSPDDFHFLIMDYKLGNDFYTFKSLAHLEFLLLDNSRFDKALAVLQQFRKERAVRTNLIQRLKDKLKKETGKDVEIKNLMAYNKLSDKKLPYKFLIIDEVHELFFGNGGKSLDYKIKSQLQDIFQLIVKQGRFFGLHIIICTQNLEGFDLGDGVMQQIKLRVAFQLASDTECRHILDTNNTIPLDLERFEAVLNTQFGRSDANALGKKYNSIFKSAFVGNDIGGRIQAINEKWQAQGYMPFEKTIVEKEMEATDKAEIIEATEDDDDDDDFEIPKEDDEDDSVSK
ncbi:MAG: hypothetical protein RLZZ292_3262, partial [Bacteroidota bacterium]